MPPWKSVNMVWSVGISFAGSPVKLSDRDFSSFCALATVLSPSMAAWLAPVSWAIFWLFSRMVTPESTTVRRLALSALKTSLLAASGPDSCDIMAMVLAISFCCTRMLLPMPLKRATPPSLAAAAATVAFSCLE
ncbi:hypothetical protein MPH_04855 [Macrophomina phaseolina MS6]|uniref:Uncharacterized protein n=1 Tax=Macrophomina phaseolina (strain MS6) TaxID=1126212 RepID=K2R685_MACPH|nr:hypothetical protein MPH_04855 [Macrophomina phaseolina MS6]